MNKSNSDIKKIRKNNKDFEKVLIGYKTDPDKYRTGNFYISPNGSKIESIYEDEYSICAVIVESKYKASIGLLNIFLHAEIKKLREC